MSKKSPTPVAAQSSTPLGRRKNIQTWIISGALATFAAVLFIAGSGIVSGPPPAPKQNVNRGDPAQSTTARATSDASITASHNFATTSNLIEDDGQTLWASPTDGQPLDLAYLPPGAQIVVALRPNEIFENPEAMKSAFALGPLGDRGRRSLEALTGGDPLRLFAVEQIVIGIYVSAEGEWLTTYVITGGKRWSPAAMGELFDPSSHRQHAGQTYYVVDDVAYYYPRQDPTRYVRAPAAIMPEIIDLAGSAPPLRRDMERLIARTDADRQVTILIAPNFLFGEGQGMFSGELARLRAPLFWFLGDEFSAATLSLHWDENFFVEVLAVPTLETLPERASQILAERVAATPDYIEEYVLALSPSEYSRRVVARFPEMMRRLAAYTRRENDRDVAMLRCYLPAIAGHNLLMAAELTLTEPPGPSATAAAAPTSQSPSVAKRLQRTTSLRFARDTLEAALNQLASDIGIEITIAGADLQLEGITKNQSFGIDLTDRPAAEILVEILRQANPDKTATGPTDPRQKLIYVVRPQSPAGSEAILITTRAQATQRGDKLPAVFTTPDK